MHSTPMARRNANGGPRCPTGHLRCARRSQTRIAWRAERKDYQKKAWRPSRLRGSKLLKLVPARQG